jgi:hypothetical protein
MILEHNDQRAALLVLVEDSESDSREVVELAAEAIDFVLRFRTDMLVEERSLSVLVPNVTRSVPVAQATR